MEVATRLAVFVGGVAVAVVTGWALGQGTATLFPDLIVPGKDPLVAVHEPVHPGGPEARP